MNRRYRYLLILLVGTTHLAPASTFPVITDLRTTITGASSATYTFTQRLVDIGAVGDTRIAPGTTKWGALSLGHKHCNTDNCPDRDGGWNPVYGSDVTYADGNDTWSQVGNNAFRLHGDINRIDHYGGVGGECIFWAVGKSGILFSQVRSPVPCTRAPPGEEWCETVTPVLTLNHGVVTLGSGRSTSSAPMEVKCTAPMTVHVRFGQDVLELARGVKASLSAPSAEGGIAVPKGASTIEIQSELDQSSDATGALSASTIVSLEYE